MIEKTQRSTPPAVPPSNAQRYADWLVKFNLFWRCQHALKHHTAH